MVFYIINKNGGYKQVSPYCKKQTLKKMNENDFILNASRTHLSDDNISVLKDLSCQNIDWSSFAEKASIHGVTTLIYYSLTSHGLSQLIPSNIYKRFQENYYRVARENSIFIDKIDKLSRIIKDKIILLKGADLIQTLYPNIALRSMCDIDILVEKERVKDIWNKLKSNGYIQILLPPKSTVHNKRMNYKHMDYKHMHLPALYDGKCCVEVHWNLFELQDFYNVTKMAWKTAISLDSNNKIHRLSNEFLLIHLCSHFYCHAKSIPILRMLCDINELILKHGDTIDWIEINEICADSELKNEVVTVLTYAHVLLKTPVPANFLNDKLINENSINLDSLLKVRHVTLQNKKNTLRLYFSTLRSLDKSTDKLIFVFRTFIPVKEWMNAKYNTKTVSELGLAYFKYWSYLFKRHILKKDIDIGN